MKNNLEAVKEVVRQLRLRDIGGIIVIDFIDMANPKNRATVEEALRNELERDRTKTYVVEISPLGLVEMTRQNVTDGPREILTTKCVVCAGDGFVVSEATHALEIERKLREIAKGARAQAFRIAVHPRVLALLAGPGGKRLEEIEAVARRRFFLVPAAAENGHVHLDHFEVLEQGKLEALKPTAAVEEGASLELKLVEVGLYDPTAGVGKVDGSEVVVAGAAKLVGKKVRSASGACSTGSPTRCSPTRPRPRRRSPSRRRPRSRPARRAEGRPRPRSLSRRPRREVGGGAELEDDASSSAEPERRGGRGARGRGVAEGSSRGRRGAEEEAHPPRNAWRTRAQEARDRRGYGDRVDEATPETDGRKTTPRIHVPSPDLAVEPRARAGAGGGPRASRGGDGRGRRHGRRPAEAQALASRHPRRPEAQEARGERRHARRGERARRDRRGRGRVSPRSRRRPPSTSRCPSGSRTSTRARRGR